MNLVSSMELFLKEREREREREQSFTKSYGET